MKVSTVRDAGNSTFYIDTEPSYRNHQFQFTVRDGADARAVPAAGTATLTFKSPGAEEYEALASNVVTLTSAANWMQTFTAHTTSIKIVLASLTAAHTLDVTLVSSEPL